MRIWFVENFAREASKKQDGARKGWTREKTLTRQGTMWAILSAIAFAVWAFAPIDDMTVTRRSGDVPLGFMAVATAVTLAGLSALTFLSLLWRGD